MTLTETIYQYPDKEVKMSSKKKMFIVILAILKFSSLSLGQERSKKIKVAVIDTGIHSSLMNEDFLCESGHKDFTGTSLHDVRGHGTHVSGLIDQHVKSVYLDRHPIKDLLAKKANYCQIIIKAFDPNSSHSGLYASVQAFEYSLSLNVDYVNYSAGGTEYSIKEHRAIQRLLDAGVTVVVAAGNHSYDLKKYDYYPANLDPRLIVVGNLSSPGIRATSSNYGSNVDVWEIGKDVVSLITKTHLGYMSGTSQATAIHTGKLIRKRLNSL